MRSRPLTAPAILAAPDHVGKGDLYVHSTERGATVRLEADNGEASEIDLSAEKAIDAAATLLLSAMTAQMRAGGSAEQTMRDFMSRVERMAREAAKRGRG